MRQHLDHIFLILGVREIHLDVWLVSGGLRVLSMKAYLLLYHLHLTGSSQYVSRLVHQESGLVISKLH